MRLIDAEKVKRKIKYIARTYGISESTRNKLLNAVDDSIVDAEPVRHGKWIVKDDIYFVCSECSELSDYECDGTHKQSLYCPNCGAKMDGGEVST